MMQELTYKMRSMDSDDPDLNEKGRQYQDFLKSFDHRRNRDLWRYFGQDFFHDGPIEEFQFSADFKAITFRTMCANILSRTRKQCGAYAWFRCKFIDVVWFQMSVDYIDKLNNPMSKKETTVEFLSSEINTLSDEIKLYTKTYKRPFYSLIIETLPAHRMIAMVFGGVHVLPEEPLAFELLRQNKDYILPLYALDDDA